MELATGSMDYPVAVLTKSSDTRSAVGTLTYMDEAQEAAEVDAAVVAAEAKVAAAPSGASFEDAALQPVAVGK